MQKRAVHRKLRHFFLPGKTTCENMNMKTTQHTKHCVC